MITSFYTGDLTKDVKIVHGLENYFKVRISSEHSRSTGRVQLKVYTRLL